MVLYGFDFAQANIDAESGLHAGSGFGTIGTRLPGPFQGRLHTLRKPFQLVVAVWQGGHGSHFIVHGSWSLFRIYCRVKFSSIIRHMDSSEHDTQPVSKSQLKREARALFDLGAALVELPPARRAAIPLEPEIVEAIELARSIRSHGARKRQLGFLGRLLRRVDVTPIQDALEAMQEQPRQLNARHHRAEQWRDFLIAGPESSVGHLLRQPVDVDIQHLRQLIRNARREAAAGKPPASARKLFRVLRALDERLPLPPLPDPE